MYSGVDVASIEYSRSKDESYIRLFYGEAALRAIRA